MRFLVTKATECKFKDKGGNYYRFSLYDGEKDIEGIQWSPQEDINYKGLEGEIIEVIGSIDEYNGKQQVKVGKLGIIELPEEEKAKYIKASKVPIDVMLSDFENYIEEIEDEYLKSLVKTIIYGNSFIKENFFELSAATKNHHVFVHGLLQHTLETVKCAKTLWEISGRGDKDIVMAGALLHDVGKCYEYEKKGASYTRTKKGKLLGHISIGFSIVNAFADSFYDNNGMNDESIDVREKFFKDVDAIGHVILAHHGIKEWGSPVEPMTPEAAIVHFADNSIVQINVIADKMES